MSEVISLAEFRTRIPIAELAIANGYVPNKKHWCNRYPVFDNPNSGDRIYIINPDRPFNQGYINVQDDFDKGTLIDFVRNRLSTHFQKFNRPDKSAFTNIKAVLYNHLLRPEPEREAIAAYLNPFTNAPKAAAPQTDFKADTLNIKPLHDPRFLSSRGITDETLRHPNFSGTIFNMENNGFVNTAFPYFDARGNMVGLEIRNRDFKQHAENSKKSIGFWHSNLPEKIEQILITESAIDALSYHQINKPINTMYVSVGGNLSREQSAAILNYTSSLPEAKDGKFLLGFDKDKDGAKYDLKFLVESNKDLLPGSSVVSSKISLNLVIPLTSKEVEGIAATITTALKQSFVPEEHKSELLKGSVAERDLKPAFYSTYNQNGILHIQILNDHHAINTFNNVLIKALGVGNKFRLEKSLSKDFNDDLKQKNAVGQGQPEKQKYRRTF